MPNENIVHKHPEMSYKIDQLVSGNMIYDNSQYSLSANGASYDKSYEGMIPQEINKVFEERKFYKKVMFKHDHNTQAIKIEMKKRGLL